VGYLAWCTSLGNWSVRSAAQPRVQGANNQHEKEELLNVA
jgi:hypothetical protein